MFHCLDLTEVVEFFEKTQFCLVGNNLCYRKKDSTDIKILKLKDDKDNFIEGKIEIQSLIYSIGNMIEQDKDKKEI